MTARKSNAVILVSGGLDSATAVYHALEEGFEPHLVHVSYGQETAPKELECAKSLAEVCDAAAFVHLESPHLGAIGGSSLVDSSMPIADASDAEAIPDTYVPFRNANLLAMGVSYAEACDCKAVYMGAHTVDFAGYPDCRPEFFDAFQLVVDEGTKEETDVDVRVPFVEWSKADIVRHGADLEVPFELTWSCYRSGSPACGTCDSCTYRLRAFEEAGVEDPIEYAAPSNN